MEEPWEVYDRACDKERDEKKKADARKDRMIEAIEEKVETAKAKIESAKSEPPTECTCPPQASALAEVEMERHGALAEEGDADLAEDAEGGLREEGTEQ